MTDYQIVENDVRLLRRILVALNTGDEPSARVVATHLKQKGLNFVLPEDQVPEERARFLSRLLPEEVWLAEKYGCILLPDYFDCIFLNSMWPNPYTLYVRLVEPVPELGVLGEKYWVPGALEVQWPEQAEAQHKEYSRQPWYRRLLGG
jgi:hypothetical protein